MKATIVALATLMLSGCVTSRDTPPPRIIEARDACPEIPVELRQEADRIVAIPDKLDQKKAIFNLLGKYKISERKKNLYYKQLVRMYDRCRSKWFVALRTQ